MSRPDALLERAQTQHELAGLVLALREPFRSTVLQHVYSDASLAEIARSEGFEQGNGLLKRAGEIIGVVTAVLPLLLLAGRRTGSLPRSLGLLLALAYVGSTAWLFTL